MKLKSAIVVLDLLSLACREKKGNYEPSEGTAKTDTTTILPLKTWVFTGQTATTSIGTVIEYASLLACDKDDKYKVTAAKPSGYGTVVAAKFKVKTRTGNCLVMELKGLCGSVEALYTYTYKAK